MIYATVQLTEEEALAFTLFRKHQEAVGYIVGYMESLNIVDLRNMSITMDIDGNGVIGHTSITRHFRKQL